MRRISAIVFACLLAPSVVHAGGPSIAHAGLPEAYAHIRAIEKASSEQECAEWIPTALQAGWPPHLIDRLTRVMYRESRCIPWACSTPDRPDLRRCRDWGLMQINDYSWKTTIRQQGLDMPAMWDSYENLRFAWWLYNYSVETTGCGWTPWSLSCKKQDRA